MKERPIPFTGESVRAILDDRKSQTRRTRGLEAINEEPEIWTFLEKIEDKYHFGHGDPNGDAWGEGFIKCPYGVVGDKLWVREIYARWSNEHDNIIYQDDPEFTQLGGQNIALNKLRALEKTTDNMECVGFWQKVSPIFMPKWAARIWLEIVNIRVERIKEISDKDIVCEGFECREDFYGAIIKINRAKNPEEFLNKWAWVINFEKYQKKD